MQLSLPLWSLLLILFLGTSWARTDLETKSSPELKALSARLQTLQTKLARDFGIKEIFIGGGSSRAILDHLYANKPLEMRDLDVFIVADQKVTADFAFRLGRSVEDPSIGKFSEKDVRPRPRANPALSLPERHTYNAGYGFFFLDEKKNILDLSVYNSPADLKLNGIFNVDRIMVSLREGETLETVAGREFRTKTYQSLLGSGRVIDADGGYQDWQRGKLNLINWTDVQSDPILKSIRLVRTYRKSGLDMPPEIIRELRGLIQQTDSFNRLQLVRNLGKLLEDKDAARELKTLAQLGTLEKWSPELQRRVEALSIESLERLLGAGNTPRGPPELERINGLLSSVDPKARLALFEDIALVDKEAAGHFRKETLRQLATSLDPVTGGPLLVKHLEGKKVGYFTGEFAPFHDGHLEVAKAALREGKLDQVLIIATPHATNDPKVAHFDPSEWAERARFAELATEGQPGIMVWPPSRLIEEKASQLPRELKLGKLVDDLNATQILGGDSLFRLIERNFLSTDVRPRIVVRRQGVPLPPGFVPEAHPSLQVLESPVKETVSATYILQELGAGRVPANISPAVLAEVRRLPRYQAIIQKYARRAEEFRRLARIPDPQSVRTILVDPEVYSGEIVSRLDPSDLEEVLDRLRSRYPLAKIEVRALDLSVQSPDTLVVMNTGKAHVSSGKFIDALSKGTQISLVETKGAPLSPLFDRQHIEVFTVGAGSRSCIQNGLELLLTGGKLP